MQDVKGLFSVYGRMGMGGMGTERASERARGEVKGKEERMKPMFVDFSGKKSVV